MLIGLTEHISLFVGWAVILLTGPPVGVVVGSTVVWEAMDRNFHGGLIESGQELSGFIFGTVLPLLERLTRGINRRLVKHVEDAFYVNATIYFSIGLPMLLRTFARWHLECECTATAVLLCYAYHVLRIGPFFMNFAYVYSLCHKEVRIAASTLACVQLHIFYSQLLHSSVSTRLLCHRATRRPRRTASSTRRSTATALSDTPSIGGSACTTA